MSAALRVVPARSGWNWLARGFALFRMSPLLWLALVSCYWFGTALLGEIPWVGPLASTVLLPAFSVSFMAMCAALDRGGRLGIEMLFYGFRSELRSLLALGGLYLVSIGAVLAVSSLADGGALLVWTLSGRAPGEAALRDGSVSSALLLASIAASPVLMAFWFAPVLVAWEKMGAVQSLFYSFFACWRNWRAFLFYGAALMSLGALFMVLIGAAALVTRGQSALLRQMAMLFTLFMLPTVFGSFYASYRALFPDGAVAAQEPPPS